MDGSWIETFGMWAVLVGALLEGEAVFVAAGYAVSQGYLPLLPTAVVAVLGASLGDHLFYLIGRRWGPRLLREARLLRPLRARATLFLRRWGRAAAFAVRFAYGMRMVMPLSIGAARFPLLLFFPFNLLGAVAFAGIYLSLGYFFGEAVEDLLGRARGAQLRVLGAILVVGALVWVVREWRLFHARPDRQDDGDQAEAPEHPAE